MKTRNKQNNIIIYGFSFPKGSFGQKFTRYNKIYSKYFFTVKNHNQTNQNSLNTLNLVVDLSNVYTSTHQRHIFVSFSTCFNVKNLEI